LVVNRVVATPFAPLVAMVGVSVPAEVVNVTSMPPTPFPDASSTVADMSANPVPPGMEEGLALRVSVLVAMPPMAS
jgi:hypothetical protein